MRRKTLLWMFPLVGIMAVIAMAILFGASSGDAPVKLTGENVVEYDHSESFTIRDTQRKIDEGEVIDGGCKFTTRLERAIGEPAKAVRTLEVNFDTCERVIEKGTLTPEDLEELEAKDGDAEGTTESTPATPEDDSASTVNSSYSGGVLASPLPSYYSAARFKTIWEDPPNLDVNWVRSEVEWLTDGGEVFYTGGECELHWVPWWSNEGGQACTWYYNSDNTQVMVKKPSHGFENTTFYCGNNNYGAETSYTNNIVGGTTVGSWGNSTTSASGDCAWLLSSSEILD